jgi:sec-independent protein translocase protein TatC
MAEPPKMTLLDHLGELRDRIIKAAVALLVGTVLSLVLFTPRLFNLVTKPMEPNTPVALRPTETIVVYFKLALIIGLVISMPVVLYQIVRFVAPGLTARERRYLVYLLPAATVSFAVGVAFAAVVMLPFTIRYLQGFLGDIVRPTYSIDAYISFVSGMLFWIGVVFETPLVIFFLAKIGVVTPQFLSANRKFAVVIVAVLAAVVTPTPDPFNMLIVMAPLLVLYEVGVFLARLAKPVAKPKSQEASAAEAEEETSAKGESFNGES